MLREVLLSRLVERYPSTGPIPGGPPDPIVRFPARSPDFGEVAVHDDVDEATVEVGRFTHVHFREYGVDLTEEERAESIAQQLVEWLDGLFDDRVLAWGSKDGVGGCVWVPPGEPLEAHTAEASGWTWSGPWSRT